MPWKHIVEWRYTSTILEPGNRWRWMVSFTSLPLYHLGRSPRYPINRRLDGPQSRSGRCGQWKKYYTAGNQTRAVQPVDRRNTAWAIPSAILAPTSIRCSYPNKEEKYASENRRLKTLVLSCRYPEKFHLKEVLSSLRLQNGSPTRGSERSFSGYSESVQKSPNEHKSIKLGTGPLLINVTIQIIIIQWSSSPYRALDSSYEVP
jgi:hypothetical protein